MCLNQTLVQTVSKQDLYAACKAAALRTGCIKMTSIALATVSCPLPLKPLERKKEIGFEYNHIHLFEGSDRWLKPATRDHNLGRSVCREVTASIYH